MKILFVLPETPETGGSGIATYLHHARTALRAAGHECMVLTWTPDGCTEINGTRVVSVPPKAVTAAYSNSPWNISVSSYLLPEILKAISDFGPDLIETSDYLAPMFSYLARRRAGVLTPAQRVPVVTFNHGLIGEVYRANSVLPNHWQRQDLAVERTSLRWSDACFVPSNAAMKTLRRQVGNLETAALIREPYCWQGKSETPRQASSRFVHAGRVSFSKGIDHVIHFLNMMDTFASIEQVVLIGTVENFPFRLHEGREYVLRRLQPRIAEKVEFTGKVPHSDMPDLIAPGGVPGFSMNFSEQETFNYVFLEQLEQGMRPFTIDRSAMAEFYPENLRNLLIPHDFDLTGLQKIHARVASDGSAIVEEIGDHVRSLTAPKAFSERYEELAAKIAKRSSDRVKTNNSRKKYTNDDVTILMATYNPTGYIFDAVQSVLSSDVLAEGNIDSE